VLGHRHRAACRSSCRSSDFRSSSGSLSSACFNQD
jgi:hypothetical protein